jgi:outer membrane protein OmpA-like peptidoglycan-associated protein
MERGERFHSWIGALELVEGFANPRDAPCPFDARSAATLLLAMALDPFQRERLRVAATSLRGGFAAHHDAIDRVFDALEHGWLRFVSVDPPPPVLDEPASVRLADLSPEAPDEPTQAVAEVSFEVRIVDEIGQALVGVPVRFFHAGDEHDARTDGNGVARLVTEGTSHASVSVIGVQSVADELATRWAGIRPEPRFEPAADVTVRYLADELPLSVNLLAKTPHTLSIQPNVLLARLLGFHFDTGATFLLPSAIPNVRAVRELYARYGGSHLLVVGHTDATEEHDDASALSLERAETTAAYLAEDVDAWLLRYEPGGGVGKRWGSAEDKLMLKSLPDFPDKPPAENAVRWFQRTRGLTVDSKAGPQTRRQLIGEYMALDDTKLPPNIAIEIHGGGDGFPLPDPPPDEQAAWDRHSAQEHRRVELFFFGGGHGVLPAAPGPTAAPDGLEYSEWLRRSRQVVDLSAEGSTKEVTMLEMADVLFRTNSCVVAPEGEDPSSDGAHPSLETVGLIATILRHAEAHPDKRLLVAGHCDTTATVAFNQTLSEERAAVVLSLVLGQREEFARLCHSRHAVADYKQILSWVARAFDEPFDCDPGTIDNVAFTGIEPVRRFQRAYNANKAALGATTADLAVDGAMGKRTWGAMFDCYEHALRLELDVDAAALADLRAGLVFVDPERKALGFSEHHPVDNLGRDAFRSQANRRVEVLFFDEGEEPDLDRAGGAPEMSEIYLPGRYERVALDPALARNAVALRLCTLQGDPIPRAPYTITMGRDVSTGTANDDGLVLLHVPSEIGAFIVDWLDPGADDEPRQFTRDVILDIDGGEEADHRRLANLGYLAAVLRDKIEEFRTEFARPPSATDDELLAEARRWHDGGTRPQPGAMA